MKYVYNLPVQQEIMREAMVNETKWGGDEWTVEQWREKGRYKM